LKELLIRTLTGISLVILVLAAILAGPFTFLVLNMVILALGIKELYTLYPVQKSFPPRMVFAFSSVLLLPVLFLVLELHWNPLFILIPLGGWIIGLVWDGSIHPGLLSMLWLAIPFSSFFALGFVEGDRAYLPLLPLTTIILIWINDTFAYLVGSKLGNHPLTPRLSPGKTWEGVLGGIIATLAAGFVIHKITGSFASGVWIVLALLTSLLGLAGDLFESSLKRSKNVKDTGGMLPGHGGILDRFDSLLFVAPVLLILFHIIYNWPW
jgi:phosphatidate cytidylyltransferase